MNNKEILEEVNQILKSDYNSLDEVPRERYAEITMKLVILILQNINEKRLEDIEEKLKNE